jgi:hypothetical protein
VDDLHFNDMIQFQFDTKYKLAGELGLVWAPPTGFLRSLAVDYTAVFPYMYTHMYDLDPDTYGTRYPSQPGGSAHTNYQDYSHAGKNLGPDLEPNSDRISLRSTWKTLPNLDLTLLGYFIRHGNASENRLGGQMGPEHDGSIFDDGSDDVPGYDNNYNHLRFLIQPHLETKLAGGIILSWLFPTKLGDFTLNAEYVAEYCWNRDLIPNNNNLRNYWSLGGSYRY